MSKNQFIRKVLKLVCFVHIYVFIFVFCMFYVTDIKINVEVSTTQSALKVSDYGINKSFYRQLDKSKIFNNQKNMKVTQRDLKIGHKDLKIKQKSIKHGVHIKKYHVEIDTSLVTLINWTNPKYPMNVNYLIENKYLCTSVRMLTVLVVVNSATDHFDRRQAIRLTWTNDKYYSHLGTVRVLFLLGKSPTPAVQVSIEKEAEISRDILQGDFMDTYLNLTHKGVMGFKWITDRCQNAKTILKVDDDFMVNMFLYLPKIKQLYSTDVYCDYIPTLIPRDKENKWYVSENHFRGQTRYKPFCKGKFVSINNDIIPLLYESAIRTPFFPYDDVLLFGYVIHNIKTVNVKRIMKSSMTSTNIVANVCLTRRKSNCTKFVIGATGDIEMRETWYNILKYFGNKRFN